MDRRLARKNLRTAYVVCAIMLIMFALSAFDAAAGNDVYVQDHADVH